MSGFYQKNLYTSHFDPPPQKSWHWVKFVENQEKNHGENLEKLVYSLSKSQKKITQQNKNMGPIFPEMG